MNVQTPQSIAPDPRSNHRYSQIIRRVYDLAALPAGVIAQYDPTANILFVAADYFDSEIPGVRSRMLACTDIMYEYQAYQD